MAARQDDPQTTPPGSPNGTPSETLEPISTTQLLRAAAELSRKLQWAIGTTWVNTTDQRAPKKQIDYLATKMAADIIDQLSQVHQQRLNRPK